MIWSHSLLHITVKYILILCFSFCACLCKIKAWCAIRGFDNKLSTFSLSFILSFSLPPPSFFLSFLNTFGTFHCKNALQIYVINKHEKIPRFISSFHPEQRLQWAKTFHVRWPTWGKFTRKAKLASFQINWTSLTVTLGLQSRLIQTQHNRTKRPESIVKQSNQKCTNGLSFTYCVLSRVSTVSNSYLVPGLVVRFLPRRIHLGI